MKDSSAAIELGRFRGIGVNQPLTEDSAALRFKELFEGSLCFCHSQGTWLKWDGAIWRHERKGLAFHWSRAMIREMAASQDARGMAIAGKMAFAAGVERGSRSDPAFARDAADWDSAPYLAGCPHCTIDLKTGATLEPKPEDGITKSLAVDPAADEDCPIWLDFLHTTFGGDAQLIRFVQQFLGYSLTADTSEHALVYGHGAGGNGKSVLLNTVAGIMGDYALSAPMETFTASKSDRHPTDVAMLRGARFVTASETEEGRAWAEAKIKQLTGGDTVRARFMRQDFFEFKPQFKLFIVGNHRPALQNVDDALRRRFNIVPFAHKPPEPDPHLEEKLRKEWPQILRWLINGCLDWQKHRLVRPDSVLHATRGYFEEQDTFGQWLADDCDADPGNPHKSEASSALFQAWKAYAEKAGEQAGDQKRFAENMRRRGFEQRRTKAARQFAGIRFKPIELDQRYGQW